MISYRITVDDHEFDCQAEETVLSAMQGNGFNCIPVGCCGGGCGICKVRVLEGIYDTKVMSRAQVSLEEENQGIVLACRTLPNSALKIERLK
jgi:ferredoxin